MARRVSIRPLPSVVICRSRPERALPRHTLRLRHPSRRQVGGGWT
jgi:hypothetical protein